MSSSAVCDNTIEFFVLVEHDGKLAEMRAEMAKLPEPSRFVTVASAAIHANWTCFIRLLPS